MSLLSSVLVLGVIFTGQYLAGRYRDRAAIRLRMIQSETCTVVRDPELITALERIRVDREARKSDHEVCPVKSD